MFQVVRSLVCKDTVAVAKWIVQRSLSGDVRGVAVCLKMDDGTDKAVFTGAYRSRPLSALSAAAHMYWAASERARTHVERS
jgi:hypothetical protein